MNADVQTSRSQLVQITPLPQLVPSRVCLSCDVCCRFPEADSPLRPYFTAEEIRRAVARGVAPAQFTDLDGCQVSVVPSPVSDGYLCPAFDPLTSHCRIYDVRPLDCQIYPLVVMWNADRTQVVLGWDSKCPFLREGKGDEAGVVAYADRIAGLLEQEDTLETFTKNPQLIGHFQDDVVLLRTLPGLTERVKVMRDESSVTGEPQSPPSTQHSVLRQAQDPEPCRGALSTQHFSSLTLADRPRFERAFASVETPLAAYAFASHFVWRALFSYSWAELDGHLSLFAEYADGVYMPLPPLPLPTGARQDASPWPMTPRPSPAALAACFAFMRARNGGSAVSRIENVPDELQAPLQALGYRVVPKDSDYLYRSRFRDWSPRRMFEFHRTLFPQIRRPDFLALSLFHTVERPVLPCLRSGPHKRRPKGWMPGRGTWSRTRHRPTGKRSRITVLLGWLGAWSGWMGPSGPIRSATSVRPLSSAFCSRWRIAVFQGWPSSSSVSRAARRRVVASSSSTPWMIRDSRVWPSRREPIARSGCSRTILQRHSHRLIAAETHRITP